jgi:galactose mutarotase-like enzyme
MMTRQYASVDERWTFSGLDTVVLENDLLRVVVLTGSGAHVQQIKHKPSDIDVLWENPRRDPYPPVFGEPWSGWLGGIDEMIPTGWASAHQGSRYPDHGEVLTQPWKVDVVDRGPDAVTVRFFCFGFMSPIRVERTMTLRAGESVIHMSHRIVNLGERKYDFLWGLHTSFNGHYDYRIDIPASKVYEEHYRQRFFDGGPINSYDWPVIQPGDAGSSSVNKGETKNPFTGVLSGSSAANADAPVDMSRPQPGPDMVLHYAMATDGWLAFTDLDRDIGVAVRFDRNVFPVLGLWILRGRDGHKLAAVVPWTGYPVRLEEAASENGICATLGPGESLETETTWTVYRGLSGVKGVDKNGVIPRTEP